MTPLTPGELLIGLVWLTIISALYFIPAIVAICRKHHQQNAILVLNLLLGWTGLGWIGALVWAATATPVNTTSA
jgi:hypothetical protein